MKKMTPQGQKLEDDKFKSKLKGYCWIARNRHLLIIDKDFNEKEFWLFTFIWDVLTDWSPSHREYGYFTFDFDTVSRQINWRVGKLRRIFSSLLGKGYIKRIADKKYENIGFSLTQRLLKETQSGFNFCEELKILISNQSKK